MHVKTAVNMKRIVKEDVQYSVKLTYLIDR